VSPIRRLFSSSRRPRAAALDIAVISGTLIFALLGVGSAGAESSGPTTPTPEPPPPRGVQTVRELPDLRTATSDTFLQSDGSRMVKIYAQAVNYKSANGTWTPIDDELTRTSTGSWQPVASPVPFELPSSLANGSVAVGPPSSRVAFALEGAAATEGSTTRHVRTYANALPGVTVSYAASSANVRETLSLASAQAPTIYRYKLSFSAGLHASIASGGEVVVSDGAGQPVYTLAAPSVTDSAMPATFPQHAPVHWDLSGDGSALSLVLDKAWLNSPNRVFPVHIDPDVNFTQERDCNIISAQEANKSQCGLPLYIGTNLSTSEVGRGLFYFNVSSIPRSSVVLESRMRLWFKAETGTGSTLFDAYGLTRAFTQSATWNSYDGTHSWTTPGGDFSTALAGNRWVPETYKGEYVSWGFTPLVEQWIQQPSTNYGVLLKRHNEVERGFDTFVQGDNDVDEDPYLEVEYSPRLGREEGDALIGPALANGGEMGVNVANGNLQLSAPDVIYSGEGYETRLARYYNQQDEDLNGDSLGAGWQLGIGESTLLYPTWWDGSYLFHEPGGGYGHFQRNPSGDGFPNKGDLAYTSPSGLNATLITHESGTRTLTWNETNTVWQFNNSEKGFPTEVIESEGVGNTITLTPKEGKLSSLSDSHGNKVTLSRNPKGFISKIEGSGGRKWTYGYDADEDHVTSYEDFEGHKTTYAYTPQFKLEQVSDESGTYVLSYNTASPAQITSIRRLVNGTAKEIGSEDEITSFEYKAPESPTCKPETDIGETIVRYQAVEEEPETYCYNALGAITNHPKETEEEAEKAREGFEKESEEKLGEGEYESGEPYLEEGEEGGTPSFAGDVARTSHLNPAGGGGVGGVAPALGNRPHGGQWRCRGNYDVVANEATGVATGNCEGGKLLNGRLLSFPNKQKITYEGGYVSGSYNGCGWIGTPVLKYLNSKTFRGCGSSVSYHFGEIGGVYNAKVTEDGTPVNVATKTCSAYANFRPFVPNGWGPKNKLGSLPIGTKLKWRYIAGKSGGGKHKYEKSQGDMWVMVHNMQPNTDHGVTWVFVPYHGCFGASPHLPPAPGAKLWHP
jgi:hypothetical protein